MRRNLCVFIVVAAISTGAQVLLWPVTDASADAKSGTATLSGTVLDGETLEPIAGATITSDKQIQDGVNREPPRVITGPAGHFSLSQLPLGLLSVRIEAEGYMASVEMPTIPSNGLTGVVYVLLREGSTGEIIEFTERAPDTATSTGEQDLGRKELTRLPGTRGDALQSIKSLPGVANADAAGSGPGLIVIRGAAPEDSKISIDGIEVPLVYHFFGLQSILPSEFIDAINFKPGGFDASEGRATGGIIDIATRSGRVSELSGFIESSFINVAGFVQGPLWTEQNLQFAAGIRRSTIDLILPAVLPDSANLSFTTAPQYYDAQLRFDWRPSDGHHLSSLSLVSFDLLTLLNDNISPNEPLLTGKFDNETTFSRMINSWRFRRRDFESKLTVAGGTTGFRVEIGADRFIKGSELRLEAREDMRWRLTPELQLRGGAEGRLSFADLAIKLPLPPAEGSGGAPSFSGSPIIERDQSIGQHVAGAYLIADINPTKNLRVSPGVRIDYFDHIRATTVSPRLNVRHQVNSSWALQATLGSYSRNLQQAEALQANLAPELATQYVLGAEHKLRAGVSATVSAFYTDRRQLVVQDPTLAEKDPENTYVNRGFGRSFGAEALLRASFDNFFGWIAYTLSRSDRIDDPLGPRRLFDFDQTHVFIAVASYERGAWSFGGRFTYSTGNPDTPIVGSVYVSDLDIRLPILGAINSGRLDAAHQLDLRIDRKFKFNTWELALYLDVTNVYAHPRVLGFRYNFDYSRREAIKELPVLPALGVRGSF